MVLSGSQCWGSVRNIKPGRNISNAFLTLDATGLQQCYKACLLRLKCEIASLDSIMLTCQLGENISESALSPSYTTGTVSRSTLAQFEPFLLDSCVSHSCEVDYVCVELTSGQSTCVYNIATLTTTEKTTPTTETTTPVTTEKTTPATAEKTTPTMTENTTPATTEKKSPVTTEKTSPATTEKTSPVTTEKTSPATTEKTSPVTTEKTTPETIETTNSATTETTFTATTAMILTTCGMLQSTPNAITPTSSESSPVGTSLKYKCASGFVLTGSAEVTCQQNGQWSSPSFTCAACELNGFKYDQFSNFCYKIQLNKYTHSDALSYCIGQGGHLAKVDTEEKIKTLANSLPIPSQSFVDGSDKARETKWVYTDGTSVNMDLFINRYAHNRQILLSGELRKWL
ncbi:uncharacterized protein [Argopecten irradians]|uniref:uncharacterized protein n=1 Tax=Argopecten irradians TaxID=31199 RepID=UPI00371499A1